VLSQPELGRRLVAEAHEHVRRFDWLDVAERTASVYEALVSMRVSQFARRALSKTGRRYYY
jgi:hypothetical protein